MQLPPLLFTDVTLLIAVSTITFIVSAELCSPHNGLTKLIISKRKLFNVALILSLLFFITITIRILAILIPM
jgi:ABC-type nitrate/sulfonate/bicarbonate transport system permease component